MSTAKARATMKYAKKTYDNINFRIHKGKREKIKEYAEKQQKSVNGYLTQLVDDDMKRKATYISVLKPSQVGYSVSFPDVPGCTASGSSVADAKEQAAQALRLHLLEMEQKGKDLPAACEASTIHKDVGQELMVAVVTAILE